MKELLSVLNIQVSDRVFLKDPQSSELGAKIIAGSIELIDTIGFESFTFRKLGQHINSPEASIYRYFESKHKLLLYLVLWYWGWMEYRLVFATANIEDPKQRLDIAVELFAESKVGQFKDFGFSVEKLTNIVISEASKVYLTREVDEENKEGVFSVYKRLVGRVSDIITEINPEYAYPHMLVSTMIEGAHHQHYFAAHLPRLTDVVRGEDSVTIFCKQMVFNAIGSGEYI